jgi:glycerate 2-kinase
VDPELFQTKSLSEIDAAGRVRRILAAALEAVDPAEAVRRSLHREGEKLAIGTRIYDLARFRRILVVGAGKAGMPMARAVEEILGERLTQGIVIVKEGHADEGSLAKVRQPADDHTRISGKLSRTHPATSESSQGLKRVTILEAGHPVPDERGVAGTRRIMQLLRDTLPDDLVVCLISGGGSALLTSPAEGLTLAELQNLTQALLASGADINAINAVRKHLDQVKGGKLARLASPAQVITLILSDVVGDPLDVIASGPTVPDRSTFDMAYQVLERHDLLEKTPASIIEILKRGRRGQVAENPKPNDALFEGVNNVIVGSNSRAARAAVDQAREDGFHATLLTTYLEGEARQAGRLLAAIARQIAASGEPVKRPGCVVAGGETTVTIQGEGYGGRNQEVALGAVRDMAGLKDMVLITLATDGGDGPTDAAGAVVTGETFERANRYGLDPAEFLARNDSYHFFERLGDLIKTGPTQTNVNDLAFIFAF